jgi:hypothetical protein
VSQSIFKLERLLRVRRLEESAAKLAVDGEVARHRACVAQVEASLRMARDAAVARNNRLGQKAVDAAQWRESEAEAGLLRSIATIEAGRLIELERGVAESRQTYLARRRQKQQAETLPLLRDAWSSNAGTERCSMICIGCGKEEGPWSCLAAIPRTRRTQLLRHITSPVRKRDRFF